MSKRIHFRVCHVCGAVNEKHEEQVERCEHCGKFMAPFVFFDVMVMMTPMEDQLRPPLAPGEYPPLTGLSASWEAESS